jgi:ribose transport system substrate-binding protein
VVASHPDAVIIAAIEPELYKKQLQELQQDEIPIVTTGVTKAEEFGIESPQYAIAQTVQVGKLLADYVAAEVGPDAQAVFYQIPELPFSKVMEDAVEEELEAVCSQCSMRSTPISAATVANTAPSTIVSDLQANPETEVALFAAGEEEIGLPATMKAAGVNVKTIGATPTPTNLQYLKEGKETAALALDLPVLSWTLLDQAAREIVGQKLSGPEAEGLTVIQFLTQDDITFDPAKGWTGYPDFAERFAKLWGVEG